MNGFVKSSMISLLVSGLIQLAAAGCSSQLPAAPEADKVKIADAGNSGLDGAHLSDHGSSTPSGNAIVTQSATDQIAGREEQPALVTQIEFTALIAGLDAPNSIIRLMEMQGSFKTWIGHVDANSELFGLNNEPVTLADFGVCSQAIVRGVQTSENEITINYLKMKNF